MTKSKVEITLAKVRVRFLQRQAALIARYEAFISMLKQGELNQANIEEIYRHIHQTAGTAVAFEFHKLSQQSLELEPSLEALTEGVNKERNVEKILKLFDEHLIEIRKLVKEHDIRK